MASVVEICNQALSAVGGKSINDITEASREAQLCNLHYESSRDQVLSETDWGFNTELVALAEVAGVTVFDWSRVFAYPTDALSILGLKRNLASVSSETGQSAVAQRIYDYRVRQPDDLPDVEYKVQTVLVSGDRTKVILTKESDDTMRALKTVSVTDPNSMTVNCREAIAMLLASKIAVSLAGPKDGITLRENALSLYQVWLTKAIDIDSNEEHREQPESEYITVRD